MGSSNMKSGEIHTQQLQAQDGAVKKKLRKVSAEGGIEYLQQKASTLRIGISMFNELAADLTLEESKKLDAKMPLMIC